MARLAMELCGKNAGYQVQPRKRVTLDLSEAKRLIEANGAVVLSDAGVLLVARLGAVEVSVYRNAKLLVKTDERALAEEVALALYGVLGVAV